MCTEYYGPAHTNEDTHACAVPKTGVGLLSLGCSAHLDAAAPLQWHLQWYFSPSSSPKQLGPANPIGQFLNSETKNNINMTIFTIDSYLRIQQALVLLGQMECCLLKEKNILP